jgi:hypothetical protein
MGLLRTEIETGNQKNMTNIITNYVWDENSLEYTAQILLITNPGKMGTTVEQVKDYIQGMAERELKKPSYMGTGGWYVTSYRPDWADENTLHMLTTLMPYSIKRYLESTGVLLKKGN